MATTHVQAESATIEDDGKCPPETENDPLSSLKELQLLDVTTDKIRKLSNVALELDKGVALAEQRFTEKVIEHKGLHAAVIIACIVSPSLLIGSFVLATNSNGKGVSSHSISAGIAHYKFNESTFQFVLSATIICTILSFFVSIARQIQVCVIFEKYYKCDCSQISRKTIRIYCWLNNIALFFNVTGYISIILMVWYDSRRFKSHTYFATYSVVSTGIFLLLTCIITTKQRYIEYKQNLIKTKLCKNAKREALKETFYYDALLMMILFIAATIFWIVYAMEYFRLQEGEEKLDLDQQRQVRPIGNIAEWLAFISLILGVMALSLSFYHDPCDDEIHVFWHQTVRTPRAKRKKRRPIVIIQNESNQPPQ